MKRDIPILLCLALFFVFKVNAQTRPAAVDSLQHLLATAKEDSGKVKLLLALGDAYQEKDNDIIMAKSLYKEAGNLSRQIHYTPGILNYLFNYTDLLVEQGLYDSSLMLNEEARLLAAKARDSASLVRTFFNIGVSYSGLENYPSAISYFLQAKDYYGRKKTMDKLGMCDNELMILFQQTRQYPKAIQYGENAITLYRRYRPSKVAIPLQNLSVVYQSMQQPEKAEPLLKEALSINKKYNDEYGELNVLINLVDLMFHLDKQNGVKSYIDRTLLLARKMKDDEAVCDGQLNMARYYLRQNDFQNAHDYADSALLIARRSNTNEMQQQCLLILSHVAYAEHQYGKALKYDEQLDLTQQEMNTANINRSIIEIQTKYETAKKEAQVKQLQAQQALQQLSVQRKKTYLIITLCIIAALLTISSLYYRNYRRQQKLLLAEQQLQQQKIAALEKEQQLMATEAVLQGQEEERSRIAKDLHDGLGGILSGAKYSLNNMKENMFITPENAAAFERTVSMLDKSITELRRVAHNMMPENLAGQSLGSALKDLCTQISSGSALQIDYHDFGMENFHPGNIIKVTVYRIVQELINNILRHAQATSAIVQVIVKDTMLNLTVEDNGKGFDTTQLRDADGIGYKNVQSRVAFMDGSIDLRSRAGEGTSVYIQIPVDKK